MKPSSHKLMLLVLLLALLTLCSLAPLARAGGLVTFWLTTMGRKWILTGGLHLVTSDYGIITVDGNELLVGPGTVIDISVSDSDGTGDIYISTDGSVIADSLDVESLYINGSEVASGSQVDLNLLVDTESSQVQLDLQIPANPSGYTYLTVNDEEVLDGESSDEIVIQGATAAGFQDLWIDLASENAEGAASGVLVNGQEVPSIALLALPTLAALAAALYGAHSRLKAGLGGRG